MKTQKRRLFILTLLIISTTYLPIGFTEDSTTLNLPEGARARLGKGKILDIKYSPEGTIFAVASAIGVWLYDTNTYQEITWLTGHTGQVSSISFSPDGQTLASGSGDGTVLLWDVAPAAPPPLATDVNADGIVNIQDLVQVAANFGATGENTADVNGDGAVNIHDLVAVAAAFGETAAAPEISSLTMQTALTKADIEVWIREARRLNLTDVISQRGIRFLQELLVSLTPKETALFANYPNPFNPETWIPYHLSKPAEVTLNIYAIDGKFVRHLDLGYQTAGFYRSKSRAAYWDGKNTQGEAVASGVYFYTLTADDFSATGKMLIRK